MLVALGINLTAIAIGQAELTNSGLLEAEPLAGIEIGITIAIFPDGQFSPGGIGLIDDAIMVVIQISQGLKTMGSLITVSQQGGITKQLGARCDRSTWLAIPNQQAIISPHPASLLGKAIAIMVKMAARCLGEGLDAIAIEIEDDGVASLPELGIAKRIFKGGKKFIKIKKIPKIIKQFIFRIFQSIQPKPEKLHLDTSKPTKYLLNCPRDKTGIYWTQPRSLQVIDCFALLDFTVDPFLKRSISLPSGSCIQPFKVPTPTNIIIMKIHIARIYPMILYLALIRSIIRSGFINITKKFRT